MSPRLSALGASLVTAAALAGSASAASTQASCLGILVSWEATTLGAGFVGAEVSTAATTMPPGSVGAFVREIAKTHDGSIEACLPEETP